MHLPLDWPRINQFPEYFTVEKNRTYQIRSSEKKEIQMVSGTELMKGYPLKIRKGEVIRLVLNKVIHDL